MTIRDPGSRLPGPLGITPGNVTGSRGRLPGPLGIASIIFMAPKAVAKAVAKTTIMPPPLKDDQDKDVHEVTWPLFSSKKVPSYTEVKQTAVPNCPVAAILAALASTPAGRVVIQGMVSENTGNVLTDISGLPSGTLTNPPMDTTTKPPKAITAISSSRYFSVKLRGGSIDVSDVLYTNDGAGSSWSLLYLQDPSEHSVWAAIIEKAVAVQLKSYQSFMDVDLKANDFWEMLTGVKPDGFKIENDTPLDKIIAAAKAATTVPTIGASKPDSTDVKVVEEFHGYAILGLQGSNIRLYNPHGKEIFISPADFRHDFQVILFHK